MLSAKSNGFLSVSNSAFEVFLFTLSNIEGMCVGGLFKEASSQENRLMLWELWNAWGLSSPSISIWVFLIYPIPKVLQQLVNTF